MLNLKIPKEILLWIDDQRGTQSRAYFIINCLNNTKNNTTNTEQGQQNGIPTQKVKRT